MYGFDENRIAHKTISDDLPAISTMLLTNIKTLYQSKGSPESGPACGRR